MKIIITMAGRSSRFFKAGFSIPKFQIEIAGKSMFEWALLSLRDFFEYEFIFICLKEHNARDFIQLKCKTLGIAKKNIIELNEVTSGQATTVLMASEYLNLTDAIIIYNIDTYIKQGTLNPNQIDGDGWIPVFKAEGSHWSFVKFDQNFVANSVAEKNRISDFGTIGLYYFKEYGEYKKSYDEFYHNSKTELYIAPMYNWFIQNKKIIKVFIIPVSDLYPLGTPDEVTLSKERLINGM